MSEQWQWEPLRNLDFTEWSIGQVIDIYLPVIAEMGIVIADSLDDECLLEIVDDPKMRGVLANSHVTLHGEWPQVAAFLRLATDEFRSMAREIWEEDFGIDLPHIPTISPANERHHQVMMERGRA